jgi:HupE / UreJ protein
VSAHIKRLIRAPLLHFFLLGAALFGCAGALAQVGLPQKAIPVALFMFNVGVEVGQLIFVGFALAATALLPRLPLPQCPWMRYVATYAIGALAMAFFL